MNTISSSLKCWLGSTKDPEFDIFLSWEQCENHVAIMLTKHFRAIDHSLHRSFNTISWDRSEKSHQVLIGL